MDQLQHYTINLSVYVCLATTISAVSGSGQYARYWDAICQYSACPSSCRCRSGTPAHCWWYATRVHPCSSWVLAISIYWSHTICTPPTPYPRAHPTAISIWGCSLWSCRLSPAHALSCMFCILLVSWICLSCVPIAVTVYLPPAITNWECLSRTDQYDSSCPIWYSPIALPSCITRIFLSMRCLRCTMNNIPFPTTILIMQALIPPNLKCPALFS